MFVILFLRDYIYIYIYISRSDSMEEKQRKFVCKYCFKRYPCGKSLGGHIRTHMTEQRTHNAAAAAAVAAADTRVFKLDVGRNKRDLSCSEGADGNNSYGLRENPRKTMRFVHSHHHAAASTAAANTAMEHEMIKFCKECGKGFPSLKALCGHMASHSEKEKKISRFDQVMEDSQSDDTDDVDDDDDDDACALAVASTMNLRKSKRRIRFKSLTLSNQNQIQNQPSSCSVNGSSSMSEMEQEQQEEVAMCLMLLSRDFFSHKGRFVSESSDNNSVVLETKSYISDKKIVIRNCNKFVSSNDHLEAAAEKKLKSVGIGVSNKSDSRDFRYASKIKIVDSKAPNYEFKRPKGEEDKSGFVDCKSKYSVTTVFKKPGLNNNKDLDHHRKFDSRKKTNYEGFGFSNNKNEETHEDVRSGLKYDELYGSEKDNDSTYDSTTDEESDEENSSESDSFPAAKSHSSKKKSINKAKKLKSKKNKDYVCPICYKIFKSGQALGGHKRSHFVGGSEENTFVIKQGAAPCLIDLNLPAPVDE